MVSTAPTRGCTGGRHLRDRAILLSFEHFQLRLMLVSEHLLLDTELRGEHRRRILQLRLHLSCLF